MKGTDFKRHLKKLALTQEQAAEKLGVNRGTIIRWVERADLGEDISEKIEKILGKVEIMPVKSVASASNVASKKELLNLSDDLYKAIDFMDKRIKDLEAQLQKQEGKIEMLQAQVLIKSK